MGNFWASDSDASQILRGFWPPLVLKTLSDGKTWHYNNIAEAIRADLARSGSGRQFHDSALSRALAQLVDKGFVAKRVIRRVFPKSSEYMLTESGRTMVAALAAFDASFQDAGREGNWKASS
ncbi:winged helix-turn-helix transcriptional regulator [Allokutzneria albata]|uniref:DNA-binding transcriptional regulator, HxlR family n=1 Tax=Allokutzneria albata TaxID=211114 RepID=A0A1G9YD87_ALLAB|nr:winged helix-turn-helix transcriptional regulator [Allokutzneria albata]SDN06465.1 DNA-binding transcriptional regulator, HxlR family [Allokutzneria albata]